MEGQYEVGKVLDMRFKKGMKEFLIRWKGHGEDSDTWVVETDLACEDLLKKFMSRWEESQEFGKKELRENPKITERMQFSRSHRDGKRNNGLRISYSGMDE